ncbi:alginate export family protein [Mesoterricola sediminis]|uniref:Alginate export domain-containing protein n=1 Tax=Mesoterricola sediminis TaxID=2927980 RepID=A0AA48GXQ6_9BACT|nr:alginate export family protein [Mesoterricola sediminis]BDU75962.1 hypothetical protein METESE_09200 [Mesoterricola sediminis]
MNNRFRQLLTPLAAGLALAALGAPRAAAQSVGLEYGFEERVRSEGWNNITDYTDALNDGHLHYRMRTRVWGQLNVGQDWEFAAGIANENRKVVRPDAAYNGREIFFETLSATWRFAPGWSVKVGRQDIMRGEGFIFMDGSALDGSRCAYVNAVDLALKVGQASKVEFIAISDPRQDKYLPRVNDPDAWNLVQRLTEWDEQALALYYTGREAKDTAIDAYAVYKAETHDYRAPSNALFQPDRHFATVGARVERTFVGGWTANAEGAWQFGTQAANPVRGLASKDIGAWAGYAHVKKAFDAPWKPRVSLGYIALSGSDPASDKIGGWNPVFSRWPKWSELYIYSQPPEKGVGYWTNTGLWEAEARVSPARFLDLRATYYRMSAFQAPAAATAYFGKGKDRGDLWQVRVDLKLNDSLKGHALYEHMAPGDFYAGKDPGYFLRFEVTYTFKGRI